MWKKVIFLVTIYEMVCVAFVGRIITVSSPVINDHAFSSHPPEADKRIPALDRIC